MGHHFGVGALQLCDLGGPPIANGRERSLRRHRRRIDRRLLVDEREQPIIEISADPVNQYIKKIANGEEIDIYHLQDFSYDNFLFLPPGVSEVYFDPGVREVISCEISFREEYIAH